ncbi:hypothetical protein BOX15_Mlig022783g2, partial [Macrostomum lignano]
SRNFGEQNMSYKNALIDPDLLNEASQRSDSSSDRSRASSPASTGDNIGCIPEELEEQSDREQVQEVKDDNGVKDEVKDDEVKNGDELNDEFKDDEVEDDEVEDDEVKDDEVKDDEVKDEEVKDDEVKDDKVKDDDDVKDEETSGQVYIKESKRPASVSNGSRTDMDLLKAILHDDSISDDVIPEEAEDEASDVDDNNNEPGEPEPTVSSCANPIQENPNDECTNENQIVDEVAAADCESVGKAELEQSVNDSEQQVTANEPETSPVEPKEKKRKKKQSLKKKKKQQKPLGPVAPWSRASINSCSRPPQPHQQQQQQQPPLASDRSTSATTIGSLGGGSRGSRAPSMSAKQLRQKYRPISNDEKMAQRLSEIDSLLARDYANEARLAYQRSVAECRQAWQNYASTARIMGHVTEQSEQTEQNQLGISSGQARHPRVEFHDGRDKESATSIKRSHPLGGRVAPELDSQSQSHPRPHRHRQATNERRDVEARTVFLESAQEKQESEQENELPEEVVQTNEEEHSQSAEQDAPEADENDREQDQLQQQQQQQLHGYRVGAPQRMAGRFGSDHKLSESNNPDVRAWLREKNRAERRQRREAREAKRREIQARLDAQQRQTERKVDAEKAFQYWSKKKANTLAKSTDKDGMSANNNNIAASQRQSTVQEPLPLSDQEAAFAALENRPRQGGHRPPGSAKPVHNSVFKRSPAILGTAGASFSGRQVRMGIIGQPLVKSETGPLVHRGEQLAIEQQQQFEVRLSFDDWSQRKSEQLAARRRRELDAERQRREAAAAADPQMSALVPQLARRRIQTATELKQRRTDTGLGLARPRTAVPALAVAPSTAPNFSSARASSARTRTRTSSQERREASITSDLPNPFVSPAEDAMLERILAPNGNGAV